MKKQPDTLEGSLKEIMSHMRAIIALQDNIEEKYGIKLHVWQVWDTWWSTTGEICVNNGIDEVAKALGKEPPEPDTFNHVKKFNHYGVKFWQIADDKQKHFTEANEEKPKIEYV